MLKSKFTTKLVDKIDLIKFDLIKGKKRKIETINLTK